MRCRQTTDTIMLCTTTSTSATVRPISPISGRYISGLPKSQNKSKKCNLSNYLYLHATQSTGGVLSQYKIRRCLS